MRIYAANIDNIKGEEDFENKPFKDLVAKL